MRVAGDDGQLMLDGLADQHSIERITMKAGKRNEFYRVPGVDA